VIVNNPANRPRPLDGIRVIDFTRFIAGPICTQYLGDLGADVIKIEDPSGGDDTRAVPPLVNGESLVFLANNRNKRSVMLDLKTGAGREAAARLIATADVVVESFATGVAERLGIGREAMRLRNPRLIYCSVSAFGRSGPLKDRPGYELMMQAFSGMMFTTGEPDGGPLRIGFSPLDQTTGIHAASAVLAALELRHRTGEGSFVEASLFETAMGFMCWHAQMCWHDGSVPERRGSGASTSCPYQAFAARDGFVLIAVGNDRQWKRLCEALNLSRIADDPAFATNAARCANFMDTVALVQAKVDRLTVEECLDRLIAAGVPSAPVNSLGQALAEPQLTERGMVLRCDHPTVGSLNLMAHPVTIEGVEKTVRRPPPRYGEHTDEVLNEIKALAPPPPVRATQMAPS